MNTHGTGPNERIAPRKKALVRASTRDLKKRATNTAISGGRIEVQCPTTWPSRLSISCAGKRANTRHTRTRATRKQAQRFGFRMRESVDTLLDIRIPEKFGLDRTV